MSRMPPANMVTGWWDLFLPGQLADYAALRKAGRATTTRRCRFEIFTDAQHPSHVELPVLH